MRSPKLSPPLLRRCNFGSAGTSNEVPANTAQKRLHDEHYADDGRVGGDTAKVAPPAAGGAATGSLRTRSAGRQSPLQPPLAKRQHTKLLPWEHSKQLARPTPEGRPGGAEGELASARRRYGFAAPRGVRHRDAVHRWPTRSPRSTQLWAFTHRL